MVAAMTAKGPPPLHWIWAEPARRLAWRRYWIRDVVSGFNSVALHFLLKLGTIDTCSNLGGAMGAAFGPRYRPHARRIQDNLKRLRPDLAADMDATMARVWDNIGRSLSEFSVIDRLWTSSRMTVCGIEHIHAARATGRARIYVAVHLSNWELLGPKLVELGEDAFEFYEPPPNRFRRALTERARLRFKDRLMGPGAANALRATRRLKDDSAALVIFIDETRRGRNQAPAFGRKVTLDGNLANAVRLALLTNALVLPAYVLREPHARFRAYVEAPVEMIRTDDREADVRRNTKHLNALLEPIVRRHLEQWISLPLLRLDD